MGARDHLKLNFYLKSFIVEDTEVFFYSGRLRFFVNVTGVYECRDDNGLYDEDSESEHQVTTH